MSIWSARPPAEPYRCGGSSKTSKATKSTSSMLRCEGGIPAGRGPSVNKSQAYRSSRLYREPAAPVARIGRRRGDQSDALAAGSTFATPSIVRGSSPRWPPAALRASWRRANARRTVSRATSATVATHRPSARPVIPDKPRSHTKASLFVRHLCPPAPLVSVADDKATS